MNEQDPSGINQHQAGAKLDAGKPDASLLLMFNRALIEVAAVGTFGARKYSRGGWQFVTNGVERYTAALLRHLLSENQSVYDKESGLRHAAQVAWNSLARLELMLREEENNNEQRTTGINSASDFVAALAAGGTQSYGRGASGANYHSGQNRVIPPLGPDAYPL